MADDVPNYVNGCLLQVFAGLAVPEGESDTAAVLAALGTAVAAADSVEHCDVAVRDALEQIAGPYAVVFHAAAFGRLYYARDSLARRSLLRHVGQSTAARELLLCSVAPLVGLPDLPRAGLEYQTDNEIETVKNTAVTNSCYWEELPASGVYWYDLRHADIAGNDSPHGHMSWNNAVRLHLEPHGAYTVESSLRLLAHLAEQQSTITHSWSGKVRVSLIFAAMRYTSAALCESSVQRMHPSAYPHRSRKQLTVSVTQSLQLTCTAMSTDCWLRNCCTTH